MSFYDEVLKDIARGLVPLKFRAADLKERPVHDQSNQYYIGLRKNSTTNVASKQCPSLRWWVR